MENTTPPAPAAAHSSRRHSALSVAARMADVARWLEEHKAANVVSLDLNGQNAFTTALVIASAGSARHARSLADGLGELCSLRNYEFLRTEGYTAGQWILVDMNDLVVNIFQEPVRALYGLEALWGAQSAGEAPQ